MIRRIFMILFYAISPLLIVVSFLFAAPIGIYCIFKYIIVGDENDKLMDLYLSPVYFVFELPDKIFRE